MTFSTLASLAFLKVNWDTNRQGYLDNFLPMIKELLNDQNNDKIIVDELRSKFTLQFGLSIPLHVVLTLLIRACKKGFVKKDQYIFYRIPEKCQNEEFSKIQYQVKSIYTNVIERFRKYCFINFSKNYSENEAEELILSFLSYNQIDLSAGTSELILKNITGLLDSQKIMIGSFINNEVIKEESLKNDFQTIVIGYMLANAIYLPEPNQVQSKFRKTSIYFDTPYLMNALGYDGEELKTPTIELLDLLRTHGAKLFCFLHTIDEIKGILYSCSDRLKMPNSNNFEKHETQFLTKGYSSSDLLIEINNLERNIEKLNIKIVEKPEYTQIDYTIDEKQLSEDINFAIGYQNQTALARDVDSISAIYRLRKGRLTQIIENCHALFVTTNNKLCYVSNSYFFRLYSSDLIPPCINDFALTTILWLKTPIQRPNLPIARIIADSYASIQPSKQFLTKWYTEIDKQNQKGLFDSKDDYYFMKYDPDVHSSIMEITLGNPQEISDDNIKLAITKTRERYEKEISGKYNQKLDTANQKTVDIGKELINLREKESQRQKRVINIVNRKGEILSRFFQVLNLLLSLILSLPIILPFTSGKVALNIKNILDSSVFIGVYLILLWWINFSKISEISVKKIEEKIITIYKTSELSKLNKIIN